jgi:hypothetical protein
MKKTLKKIARIMGTIYVYAFWSTFILVFFYIGFTEGWVNAMFLLSPFNIVGFVTNIIILSPGILLFWLGGSIEDKIEENKQNGKDVSDHDVLTDAYNLIRSSNRPMPAYFTGGNGRKKTFGINFEVLTENDEYEMAGATYQLVENFVQGLANTMQRTWIVRLGEDAMLGAYIITKLGKSALANDLEKKLTEENIKNFRDKTEEIDVDKSYALKGVREYIDYCVEEGRRLALTGLIKPPSKT